MITWLRSMLALVFGRRHWWDGRNRARADDPDVVPGSAASRQPLMRGRLETIDALRGLAALSVAWFHMTNTYEGGLARLSGRYGWLGVEVFFVISGFVIPYSIATTYERFSWRDGPGFLLRRMVRLEPPYLVSIALVIVLWEISARAPGFQGGPPNYTPWQVASHLLYGTQLLGEQWLQPVYWTLAYEFVFYLFCGLTFGIIWGIGPIVFLGGALAITALTTFVVPSLFPLFVMGTAVFRRLVRGDPTPVTVLIIAVSIAAMASRGLLLQAIVGAMTAVVIGFAAQRPLPFRPAARALLPLGAISYSLYLIHIPIGGRVVNLGRRFVEGGAREFLLSLVALVVSVAVAAIFWAIVERPATALARRIRIRRAQLPLSAQTRATVVSPPAQREAQQ